VLTQELILYLGLLIMDQPDLFRGLLTVRIGQLITLLTSELARETGVTADDAHENLMHLAPSVIEQRQRRANAGWAAHGS
jgi:phosphorylase kinase alpha/beta subunit